MPVLREGGGESIERGGVILGDRPVKELSVNASMGVFTEVAGTKSLSYILGTLQATAELISQYCTSTE